MKLLIGLGNPGEKYTNTRHNAGFLVLDEICDRHNGTQFLYQQKFEAEVATGIIGKYQFIAVKPMCFMNKSGQSVLKIMQFYKIKEKDCLIFHDDIDIPNGSIKLKFNGSHGGHNGVRDIYAKTGTDRYWKMKLGVGRPTNSRIDIADYVLGKMHEDEIAHFIASHKEIDDRIVQYLKNTG